jgi:hypothetical protein
MKVSLNNRFIVEQYVKSGLIAKISGGIATPGQRDGLKGLKVLVDATVSSPNFYQRIPAGSIVYIKEEALHSHPAFSKPLTADGIEGKFLIVDLSFIEFVDIVGELI